MNPFAKSTMLVSLAIVSLTLFTCPNIAQAVYVSGVNAIASTALADVDPVSGVDYGFPGNKRYPNNITDGVGRNTQTPDGNPGDLEGMWLSQGETTPSIVFDMGSSMVLESVDIYNYAELEAGVFDGRTRGIQTLDISWSNDNITFTPVVSNFSLPLAGSTAPWGPSGTAVLGVTAQYIKFQTLTNWGDSSRAGLNEVEFYNNIPPASVTQSFWIGGSGDWGDNANWSTPDAIPGPSVVPNFDTFTATFGDTITTSETVYTNSAVTVKNVAFDNLNSYVIAGGGSVNLSADTGNASVSVAQGSHQFQTVVNLNSTTDVDVATNASLVFTNALNLGVNNLTKTGAGTLEINNALNTGGGTVSAVAGIISGVGLVSGGLDNMSATIAPGNSPGMLSVGGDYAQAAVGTLDIEIGGTAAGEFDLLNVAGMASLDGTLDVSFFDLGGGLFSPSAGDSFEILTAAGGITGTFSTDLLPSLAGDLAWTVNYAANSVSLEVASTVGLAGDFDLDGDVDGADFLSWQRGFGTTNTAADLTDWESNFGSVTAISTVTAVPEPSSLLLLLTAVMVIGYGRNVEHKSA